MPPEIAQVRRLRLDAIAPEPWRNGLGITRTIAAEGDGPDWRVSVAEVRQDGPFSCFPGMDRIAMLLSGRGLVLEGDCSVIRLGEAMGCARFAGETPLIARLDAGPVRVLNVMTRRNRWSAFVELGQGPLVIDAGPAVLLVLEGELTTRLGEDGPALSLRQEEALVLGREDPVRPLQASHGRAHWMLVRLSPA